jgi:DNA-binding MarR family transcriptional regulator
LGQKLKLSSATMTGILDRLEKLDLVERQPHPKDRRAILICLTDQGQKYAKEINTIMVKANKAYLENLDSEQLTTFRETLKNLSEVNL